MLHRSKAAGGRNQTEIWEENALQPHVVRL